MKKKKEEHKSLSTPSGTRSVSLFQREEERNENTA